MRKTSLEPQQKCPTQKVTPETPNIWKITGVAKSENFAILQKRQFGPKIEMFTEKHAKNVSKATTEMFYAKIHSKNAWSSKNEKCSIIRKFCDNAWAIAFAETSIWVKN